MHRMGKVSAASVSSNLRSSFPRIRLGLLVGICGGVPFTDSDEREILLGDVIISTKIVQTDFGRLYPDKFIRKDTLQDNLGRLSSELEGFMSSLQGKRAQTQLRDRIQTNLAELFDSHDFELSKYPGTHEDKLFEAAYRHKHQDAKACTICSVCMNPEDSVCVEALELPCDQLGCDSAKLIPRLRIQKMVDGSSNIFCSTPTVHFGGLASGDQVIKSAHHRDRIARQENVIAFEMEGAGLWGTIPTIVVKGVCDYADSHKNDRWQLYAAATAAACAKGILKTWRLTTKQTHEGSDNKETAPWPTHQVFSGTFIGKNFLNGGTYTADSINF
ncbi:purine and uridine phosphorylase [Aspergillus alliaceus]|uniref:Purine and uridine phosphorylase n=1 Tax=Petromyces alliaceus TaxID=209559 RepID=A0A5N7BYI8_PETAA|nr:purine and uridine phosphorylase [Aspergillus alliaceus]